MAAGLGFKTFNTGDVLSAADTNGYLMQGVLVFASAAARDAAITSPQEGQCCYLKDTDAVQTYSGSAWVGFDDSNAIQNSIVDAKGDIVAASGNDTPARLAVGNNGDTIVADSATATGLRYKEDYAAGKNKIINGDFGIWQRGTSFTTNGAYTSDRFVMGFGGTGTAQTVSQQTFTAGTAPVSGYEGTFFCRNAVTGGSGTSSLVVLTQKIEDVRTFAGQTVTVSFWAKANTGTPSIGLDLYQEFGSGGSSTVSNGGTKIAITTSWARYSATISVASISGKTIGAGSLLGARLWFSSGSDYNSLNNSLGIQSNTFDIWGVQVEESSVATAFQTATGTIQGELAACQRYYQRFTTADAYSIFGTAVAQSTTQAKVAIPLPVTMRIKPSAVDYSTLGLADAGASIIAATAVALEYHTNQIGAILVTVASGLTQNRPCYLFTNNSASAYLGYSAEL
jgi:hypothetical protein